MDNVPVPNVTIPLCEYNNLIECRKKLNIIMNTSSTYIQHRDNNITVVLDKNKIKEMFKDNFDGHFKVIDVLLRR